VADASIVSAAFVFAEHPSMNVTDQDESTWKPTTIPIPPPRQEPAPLASKFVYAFRKLGTEVRLAMEYSADKDGNLSVRDGRERREFERDNQSVSLNPTKTDETALPHTINGRKALYFFVGTRMRLPADGIRQLENDPPPALPLLDLSKDESFLITGNDDANGQSVVGRRFVGVIDPFTVALTLHRQYEEKCNEVLNFTAEFKEQSPAARERVRGRHKTLLLARLLKEVLDKDPKNDLGLRNEFADGSGDSVRKFVSDYEQHVNNLMLERDRRGHRLCRFLRSKLLATTEELHLFFEQKDYNVFLDVMGAVHERLNECAPGRARLGALIDQRPRFIKVYVLPEAPLTEEHFQAGRKSAAAIMGVWKELLPALHMKKGAQAPSIIVASIELVTRETLVQVRQVTETISYRPSSGFKVVRTTFESLTLIQETELRVRIARWVAAPVTGGTANDAALKVGDRLLRGIEVANLMISFTKFVAADGSDKPKAALNLLGSTLDAVGAFGVMLKLSEKSIKTVGMVSAAVDAILAALDARDAYRRNDTSNVVGLTLVTAGSVLMLVGCTCAVAGVGASSTIVGVPLGVALEALAAIIIAVGWLITAFSADSEIEQMVSHCKFGDDFGKGTDQPKWADGAFFTWAQGTAGLDRQIRTLFNILGAFTLEASNRTAVTILPGLLTGDSEFEVSFDAHYNLGIRHRPRLRVQVGSRTMTQAGGDPADLTKLRFFEDTSGRLRIEVTAEFPPGKQPPEAVQHQLCTCEVRLRLGGNAPMSVPLSGGVVPFVIDRLGTGLSSSTPSSKDF
jgi:hypothetical protein